MNTLGANTPQNTEVVADNLNLRKEFEHMGLDVDQIIASCPPSAHHLNRRLHECKHWVRAYHRYGSRKCMERHGFLYPPVDLNINPEADWHRFERWVHREPLSWNLKKEISRFAPPETLNDEQAQIALNRLEAMLVEHHACFDAVPGVPPRVSYRFLYAYLREAEFLHTDPMTITHIGCDGYCPDCCMCPYCDIGRDSDWDGV